jgi:uroporphyrinogen decarboxylase
MTGRERIAKTLAFEEPDRPPHFEQMFELTQEAFGLTFPTEEELAAAVGKDREALFSRCGEIYKIYIEAFWWDAVLVWRPAIITPADNPSHPQYDFIPYLKKLLGPGIPVGSFLWEALICIDTIKDYMDFSIRLVEDRPSLIRWAEDMFERGRLHLERLLDAGIDFVDIASDHAFNSGMFLSPSDFRELTAPYAKRLVQIARDRGAWVIMHSDGNLMGALEDIISIGPDVLQSIDPMAGMDIAEIKKQTYGKFALMGNVQCSSLQTGPEENILGSCKYCLDHAAPGGGYIFSSSNTIFPGIPLENYRLMLNCFGNHFNTR